MNRPHHVILFFVTFGLFSKILLADKLLKSPIQRVPAASSLDLSDTKPWNGQAELSLLSTEGNTKTLSFGIKTSATRNWQFWALDARGEYLQTRDDALITAESYLLGIRGTRKLRGFDVFSDNEYQQNKFAGFQNLYKIALGLGKEAIKTELHTLRIEAGPAVVIEELLNDETLKFGSLSTQILHQWVLADKIKLNNRLAYLANLNDFSDSRYELELGFAAPVSGLFSLKASYLALYRNQPPAATKNFDGKTTLSLLATF